MSHVLSVAKEFVRLSLSGDEADPLTNLRLQKLLYYAQAWSLVLRESELYPEELEAWRCGPVAPTAFQALPGGRAGAPVPPDAFAAAPDLSEDEAAFVRCVWEAHNPCSALQLTRMTREEAPWRKVWGDRPRDGTGNGPISMTDLEEFFSIQTTPAPLAAYRYQFRKRVEEAERALAELAPLDADRLLAAANSFTPSANHLTDGG